MTAQFCIRSNQLETRGEPLSRTGEGFPAPPAATGPARTVRRIALAAPLLLLLPAFAPYAVEGDAIPAPLEGRAGDPARGRAIATDARKGLCTLCHAGLGARPEGDLGPSLAGVGARLSPGQLRLRLVDGRALNPATVMPSYYRIDGLTRVGPAWRDRPILEAAEIEDVVAYLATLRREEEGR